MGELEGRDGDPETIPATYQDRDRQREPATPISMSGVGIVAIGVIFNFPGGTTEQYDEVCQRLNNGQPMRSLADWPGGGCLSHAAGATPDGLCVLDVWESPEKFQAFGEKLMPLVQQAGLKPDEPIIFPAYNFVNQ